MKKEIVNPYIGNFIKSLRDIGYNFEIAVADVLDNSLDAGAKNIKIKCLPKPVPIFVMYDDGKGLNKEEIVEAMRLASKDPEKTRGKKDLGKFGLGLKTASFSQCKKLTIISKENKSINIRQWDLDYIGKTNEWALLEPDLESYKSCYFVDELLKSKSGTIVIWEEMDRYKESDFSDLVSGLKNHLALVFHRFIEGGRGKRKVNIEINNGKIEAFNPFNLDNMATQELSEEKIRLQGEDIKITPYILPHHSKTNQNEYKKFGTTEGYTKAQGFYLYRANRLLIHGTWLGLHKISDAHKLVRIKIDIPNNQDDLWGIDIKKSKAKPAKIITDDLRRIIGSVTEKGVRPYTGRGKRIIDKSVKRFWDLIPTNEGIRFGLSKDHPLYTKLFEGLGKEKRELLDVYLSGLEAYIPLNAIQAKLNQNPHEIEQQEALKDIDVEKILEKMKELNIDDITFMEQFMKTEFYK